jgi:hypothetical protein
MNETQARTLVDTYAKQQASLVAQLLRVLLGIWIPFRWANRPDLVNAIAAKSTVEVDLALVQARRLSRAYQTEVLRGLGALPTALPPVEDLYPRSDTPIVEVYKRPARQYEHAIRQGQNPEQAEKVLTERLTQLVDADMVAAARDDQSKVRQASPKVLGYRRILHPEKSKYGPCGLCIVAADRIYKADELQPLHGGCYCTSLEIVSDADWGSHLNRADLDELYKTAGSNYAEDLKRVRVTVQENGELGPILVRDGNAFKTVGHVNSESNRRQVFTPYRKPTKQSDVTNWDAMRATSQRSIRILEDAKASGTNLVSMTPGSTPTPVKDIDKAIEYHRALIARALAHAA